MLYAKIKTDRNGSAIGVLESVRRSMTRTDSTVLKIGGQGYIRKMSDEDHEALVNAVNMAVDNAFHTHSGLYNMEIDGTWSAR